MRCTSCNGRLVQTDPNDGRHKIRSPILVFEADGSSALVKCRHCKEMNRMPVSLNLRSPKIVVPAKR